MIDKETKKQESKAKISPLPQEKISEKPFIEIIETPTKDKII